MNGRLQKIHKPGLPLHMENPKAKQDHREDPTGQVAADRAINLRAETADGHQREDQAEAGEAGNHQNEYDRHYSISPG